MVVYRLSEVYVFVVILGEVVVFEFWDLDVFMFGMEFV